MDTSVKNKMRKTTDLSEYRKRKKDFKSERKGMEMTNAESKKGEGRGITLK